MPSNIPAAPGQDCPSCGKEMLWKYLDKPRCGHCDEGPSEGAPAPVCDAESFQRDHSRYIVIKLKDLGLDCAAELRAALREQGIPTRECVVVEPDWPIYDGVWELVRRLDQGETLPYMVDRKTLAAAFRTWLGQIKRDPDAFYSLREQMNQSPDRQGYDLADHLIECLTQGASE